MRGKTQSTIVFSLGAKFKIEYHLERGKTFVKPDGAKLLFPNTLTVVKVELLIPVPLPSFSPYEISTNITKLIISLNALPYFSALIDDQPDIKSNRHQFDMKDYFASGQPFHYPSAGDTRPPGGADVLLLTTGGVCIRGKWLDDGSVIGWAPFPKRDHSKEKHFAK